MIADMAQRKKHPPTWRNRLRAIRKAQSLSQRAAAEKVGVAVRTWIAWENRQSVPSRLTLILLQEAFPELS